MVFYKLEVVAVGMIQGFRINNFRALKDVTLGRLWNNQSAKPLTPLTVVIGQNGVGKSSLFDAFGFLSDCLKVGVEEACEMNKRGGYGKIHSAGTDGPISFEIYFRETVNARPMTYELAIDLDKNKRPYVLRERLRQRRKGQAHGRPFSFLILNEGKGVVWKGDAIGIDEDDTSTELESYLKEESTETELVELADKRRLGIVTLGALKQHPRISLFRNFIEGWFLSYFTPDAARSLPFSGAQKQLSKHGDNLSNVVQYMEREQKNTFKTILAKISDKIPGIQNIETEQTPDDRLLLKFYSKGFSKPFYAQQMSDGTLKMFSYLLLLYSSSVAPFLCIEEPENGLYHKLLPVLAEEFRVHANGKTQIFVTTHQPYFVDNLTPDEVWILKKDSNGFSNISRASKSNLVENLVQEDIPLGSLWINNYLD